MPTPPSCPDPPPDPAATAAGAPAAIPAPPRRAARPGPSPAQRLRAAHAALAPWVLAPLLLTVSTGLGYRLLRDWGGLSRDRAHGLMVLHEGEWLRRWFGANGETVYVLLNGLGLLWMLGSGAAMLSQRLRRPRAREGGGGGT